MNRFYARVKTKFETVTVVIKHKTVHTIEDVKNRLVNEYKFTENQILSISTTSTIFKTVYSYELKSLFRCLDKISRIKDMEGYLGSL